MKIGTLTEQELMWLIFWPVSFTAGWVMLCNSLVGVEYKQSVAFLMPAAGGTQATIYFH